MGEYVSIRRVLSAGTVGNNGNISTPHHPFNPPPPDNHYKSHVFPVTGSDDSECNITKCSEWDWSNHTHIDSPSASPSGGLSPSSIPSFVHNMSYVPDFVCYDDNIIRWTAATWSQFEDPVPPGYVVTMVRFESLNTTFFIYYNLNGC